jgi:DNA-binding MarR family transcriptional regulator
MGMIMTVSDAQDDAVPAAKPHREAIVRELGAELNALISASRAVMAEAAESFRPPISGSAFHVVQWLHSFGPAKASRIADALVMDRSVVSRLTKQLGQRGLAEPRPDDQDGRGVVYSLTKTGRAKAAEAIASKGNLFEMRIKHWQEADLEHLTRLLRRLNGRA